MYYNILMLAYIQIGILGFTIFFNILLALFVYRNNPRSATNILFGILSVLLSIWIFTFYPAINRYFSLDFLFWAKMSIFIGAPQTLVMFLFARAMPSNKLNMKRGSLYALLALTLAIMLLNISPYAFIGVDYIKGEPTISAGLGILPFAVYSSALTFLAIFAVYSKMRASRGREKEQMKFVMIGIATLLTLAILTILIPVVVFNNNSLVPFAPLYALVFLSMTAYAIINHGFLDIRLIVARAISFIFAGIILALFYGLAVYSISKIFPSSGLLVIVLALLSFKYVQEAAVSFSNKIFFRKDYESESLMDGLTRIMANTLELGALTQKILEKLAKEMSISRGVFVVFDNHQISDIRGVGYSLDDIKKAELDIIFHTDLGSQNLIFEEMEESPLKQLFRELDVSFAFPIAADGKDIALLLLGPKLSGDIYFDRDIQFLNLFAREAGIAIQNAKTYEEIKILNRELEQRVEARTKDLKESQARELEKAQSVAKLKDEFVFVAAHELRAPITAIRGFLELVGGTKTRVPKGIKENLDEIQYASDHLNQLVNDLLEIARSDAGTMAINNEAIDLTHLVGEVLAELAPLAEKRSVKLQNDTRYSFKALADPAKVKEIIVNLISNAIKYNKENGTIFAQVVSAPDSDRVFVEIRDTGYGIPTEEQSKIFGKFFRASGDHNTSNVQGTGLGLFITKMLVEKMGGEISFTSVPGEGTTFSFYLKKAE